MAQQFVKTQHFLVKRRFLALDRSLSTPLTDANGSTLVLMQSVKHSIAYPFANRVLGGFLLRQETDVHAFNVRFFVDRSHDLACPSPEHNPSVSPTHAQKSMSYGYYLSRLTTLSSSSRSSRRLSTFAISVVHESFISLV